MRGIGGGALRLSRLGGRVRPSNLGRRSCRASAWLHQRYEGLEALLVLPDLGLALPLSAIYQQVDFPLQLSLRPSLT